MYYSVNFLREMNEPTLTEEYKKFIQDEKKEASALLINYIMHSQNDMSPFPFSLIVNCFEKAYNEVCPPNSCYQVMASYRYENESILRTLPKELIAYIFEIHNQLPYFDKFHADLETKGQASDYLDTISKVDRNEFGYNAD